ALDGADGSRQQAERDAGAESRDDGVPVPASGGERASESADGSEAADAMARPAGTSGTTGNSSADARDAVQAQPDAASTSRGIKPIDDQRRRRPVVLAGAAFALAIV